MNENNNDTDKKGNNEDASSREDRKCEIVNDNDLSTQKEDSYAEFYDNAGRTTEDREDNDVEHYPHQISNKRRHTITFPDSHTKTSVDSETPSPSQSLNCRNDLCLQVFVAEEISSNESSTKSSLSFSAEEDYHDDDITNNDNNNQEHNILPTARPPSPHSISHLVSITDRRGLSHINSEHIRPTPVVEWIFPRDRQPNVRDLLDADNADEFLDLHPSEVDEDNEHENNGVDELLEASVTYVVDPRDTTNSIVVEGEIAMDEETGCVIVICGVKISGSNNLSFLLMVVSSFVVIIVVVVGVESFTQNNDKNETPQPSAYTADAKAQNITAPTTMKTPPGFPTSLFLTSQPSVFSLPSWSDAPSTSPSLSPSIRSTNHPTVSDAPTASFFPSASPTVPVVWTPAGSDIVGRSERALVGRSVALSEDGDRLFVGGFQQLLVYDWAATVDDWILKKDLSSLYPLGDMLGISVSSDGNHAIIHSETVPIPTVMVLRLSMSSTWNQVGQTLEVVRTIGRESIDIIEDGRTIAIGGKDEVRLMTLKNGNVWESAHHLEGPSGSDFGYSLSMSSDGTRIAIGAPESNNLLRSAFVYELTYDDGSVSRVDVHPLVGNDYAMSDDRVGYRVSIDGDGRIVVVGSISNLARVFRRRNDVWRQIGDTLRGSGFFGRSVYLSSNGRRLAIGAPMSDGSGQTNRGMSHVYSIREEEDGGCCVVITRVGEFPGESAGDKSGWAMAISRDGRRLAIGARYNNRAGEGSGHVRVFDNTSGGRL